MRKKHSMTDSTSTPFSNKVDILGEFWITYKNDPEFSDFVSYNDLGLPLAYAISAKIVESSPIADTFITETFELLLSGLEIEDTGFDSLEDIFLLA